MPTAPAPPDRVRRPARPLPEAIRYLASAYADGRALALPLHTVHTMSPATNGHSHPARPLKAGIYAPIPTFFLPDSEDLGVSCYRAHTHACLLTSHRTQTSRRSRSMW
jgi:hypothetical protein